MKEGTPGSVVDTIQARCNQHAATGIGMGSAVAGMGAARLGCYDKGTCSAWDRKANLLQLNATFGCAAPRDHEALRRGLDEAQTGAGGRGASGRHERESVGKAMAPNACARAGARDALCCARALRPPAPRSHSASETVRASGEADGSRSPRGLRARRGRRPRRLCCRGPSAPSGSMRWARRQRAWAPGRPCGSPAG